MDPQTIDAFRRRLLSRRDSLLQRRGRMLTDEQTLLQDREAHGKVGPPIKAAPLASTPSPTRRRGPSRRSRRLSSASPGERGFVVKARLWLTGLVEGTPMTTCQYRRIGTIMTLTTLGAAGWGCTRGVRPDEMSAEAHRREAAKVSEQATAEAQAPKAPPPNLAVNPSGDPQGYYSPVNPQNPAAEQAAKSERLSAHARQHLNAAAYLDASEDATCRSTPRATRAACPLLGPATSIEVIPGGVRVRFTEGASVDGILTHMRCHLAYARSNGFRDVASCPLYVRGVEVVRGQEPRTINIVSKDAKVATEISARAHEEVVVVRGGAP